MNLTEAICVATQAHDGVDDLGGKPYIRHPLRVMEKVAHHGEDAMVVAALHDVVEDTPYGLEQVYSGEGWVLFDGPNNDGAWRLQAGDPGVAGVLSIEQGDALEAITRGDDEIYADYIERVSQNDLATIVKVADLLDNLSPVRMAQLPPEKRGIRHRYERSLAFLRRKL